MKNFILILLLLLTIGLNATPVNDSTDAEVHSRAVFKFLRVLDNEEITLTRWLRKDGSHFLTSTDSNYNTLKSIKQLQREENRLLDIERGKISRALYSEIILPNPHREAEKIFVNVRLNIDVESLKTIIGEISFEERVDTFMHRCSLSTTQLQSIKNNCQIVQITIARESDDVSCGDELGDWLTDPNFVPRLEFVKSAYMFPDGFDYISNLKMGDGVNVGVLERGVNSLFEDVVEDEFLLHYKLPYNAGSKYKIDAGSAKLDAHTHMTFYCMAMAAPKAVLHARSKIWYDGIYNDHHNIATGLWIDNNNVETISCSMARDASPSDMGMIRGDMMVYNPNAKPLFCNPTANNGMQLYANWGMYNGINIGGCSMSDFKFHEITEFMWFKDIDQTGTSPNVKQVTTAPAVQTRNFWGDKEVPHVVVASRSSWYTFGQLLTPLNGLKLDGTSAGAPIANGVAASIISENTPLLRNYPENVKASMMVTAINIDGGYWDPLVDQRDGCGALNGYGAIQFVKPLTSFQKEGSDAVESGLANETIGISTTPRSYIYKVKMPNSFPKDKHFRAVLTWNSVPDITNGANTISDLNLHVKDLNGRLIKSCASMMDNVEVVDITSLDLLAGQEYLIEVEIDDIDFPSVPVSNTFNFALAWTWVNDFAGRKIVKAPSGTTEDLFLNRNKAIVNVELESGESMTATAAKNITIRNATFKPGSSLRLFTTPLLLGWTGKSTADQVWPSRSQDSYTSGNTINVNGAPLKVGINKGSKVYEFHTGNYGEVKTSETLGDKTPVFPPYNGLTLSLFSRFFPEEKQTGYIYNASDADGGYSLDIDNNNTLTFIVSDKGKSSSLSYTITDSELNVSDQNWVHIAAMWDPGEKMKLYINGIEKASENTAVVSSCNGNVNKHFISTKDGLNGTIKSRVQSLYIFGGILSDEVLKGVVCEHSWPHWQY